MDIDELARALERAQDHAYPGREAAERDQAIRELWRLLVEQQRERSSHRVPRRLRLVRR